MEQLGFAAAEYAAKNETTPRERFFAEMDQMAPWQRLIARIEPYYPKVGPQGSRPPMPLETMRRCAGLQLGDTPIRDETPILKFHHLLKRHGLAEQLFAVIVGRGASMT